ncbi:hypothetical protein SAMN04488511_101502 [Pedobacter suwonensis]|uniref:Lipocalin-like domain-containing protein n=1 Tax=Pedobacter suwonensis TaxID=332999 RepID=A0A1I0SJK4_9SPHI|nr:hypothetical protein [Pedobacter suwonensis]SFA39689.1 hypothetical protein SAMN04488511_101502 [Pedobacter suwonensis]
MVTLFLNLFFAFSTVTNPLNLVDQTVKPVTAATAPPRFEGTWKYVVMDEQGVPESQFTLTLHQEENRVKGQYCAITQSGGKTDCEPDVVYNLQGTIQKGKLIGRFYSFFGMPKDKGSFELSFLPGQRLQWKVTHPTKSVYYAPEHCVLKPVKQP